MTGRRRVLFFGAGVLATAGVLGAYGMMRPRPGVTRANCERIRDGMTLRQVEDLLGGPPTYTDEPGGTTFTDYSKLPTERAWLAAEGTVTVRFMQGRVQSCRWQQRPLLDRLRRLLPW
jgi:hypothetical protein